MKHNIPNLDSFPTEAMSAGIRDLVDGARGIMNQHSPRRMGRGDVRAAILALLAEEPMHGYQIIREIEERSGGGWKPSPGSIYPTLQLLADEGLVAVENIGEKKTYQLTEEGITAAAEGKDSQPWDSARVNAAGKNTELPKAAMKLRLALSQIGHGSDAEQISKAVEIVDEARRKIYLLLAES